MVPCQEPSPLERLLVPISLAAVEIGVVIYVAPDGSLAGVRHVRGRREGVDMPVPDIVGDALTLECRTAVMAHNHPSGDVSASPADVTVTRKLAAALRSVGVKLYDHIIVAGNRRRSMRASGQL